MNLSPESVSAYKKLMIDPKKHGLDFPSLFEIFEESKIAIPKHLVYKQYLEIVKKDIPKVFFYIIMDQKYFTAKAENGDLGYCLQFNPGVIPDKEFTGVLTRDGEKICVGDKVDTVQGNVFDVIKLEHISGVKYALHDGKRPYDLEPFMSPNLWLVGNDR